MAIGGVGGTGKFGNTAGNQGHAAEKSGGEEFNLEHQSTSTAGGAEASGIALSRYEKKSKISKLVDKKKRNRKGAPRTVLVDGEIFEVYLLAIA